MKREDLTKLNLTDEQVDAVMKLHGSDIEKHKGDIAAAKAELEAANKQLAEASAAIDGFKKLDIEGVKKSADEWRTKAEQAEAARVAEIAKIKFDHALDVALTGAKAKNAKAVKALLNMEALKLIEDGSILGLSEQLEKIKSEADYLFDSGKQELNITAAANNSTVIKTPLSIDQVKRMSREDINKNWEAVQAALSSQKGA